MAGVKGQWELNLSVGGVLIPVTKSLIQSALIRPNIHNNLPTLTLSIRDAGGRVLDNVGFVDGQQMNIEVGDGTGAGDAYRFTVQGAPMSLSTTDNNKFAEYQVTGVLDKIEWMRKIFDRPIKGTSADVLKQMAAQVGLQFSGDNAADQMTWLPNRTPFVQYARFVTERAYASATSCFLMGVTETGKLLFRDLDKIIKGGVTKSFGFGNGDIPYLQRSADSKAGAYNNQSGYGASTIFEQLDGTFKELNKISLTKISNFLNVGSAIQSAIGEIGGRLNILPMGGGNTHANWEQALHQNTRIKALWAHDLSILVNRVAGVELLENVKYNPVTGSEEPKMTRYGGNYVVTAKVFGLMAGNYVEKYTLTSQGLDGEGLV